MQGHKHPEDAANFRITNPAALSPGQGRKRGQENKLQRSCIHILLRGTQEHVFISQQTRRYIQGCLPTYLSYLCGFKEQVI